MSQQRLLILGTGGTIAGRSAAAGDNVGYRAGELSVNALLAPLAPQLSFLSGWLLEAQQLVQLDSKDMDESTWMCLARTLQAAMADPSVGAVVVTHGTDTLEETAYFLSRVLSVTKPVVMTCAMRPATALCPDGPQNLLDALVLASSATAAGLWVVAAGAIHSPTWVTKAHPYRVDAFSSGEAGAAGWVEEGQVRWRSPGVSGFSDGSTPVPLACLEGGWPRVEVVFSHGGAHSQLLEAVLRPVAGVEPVRGLVVAGTGNGTIHRVWLPLLMQAQEEGVVVWRTSRCWGGSVVAGPDAQGFPATSLPPFKARLALTLHLAEANLQP